ncbi:hypothetical protein METBIDRAFT_45812 [Metschnikowia bicuspidata var. bicuspidata NRRL YB-4993]|uniref:Uncharacterized protein n=1 Tax=Metschnikowia bicuspidata var. bicuspidata NRRL YB-4993 TaxID=869754 RepID=A0A1A0H606_9ASCO|nr:hypothetical protein METBIDRAFT_45812 [Metschnikowia bicuspidata var. bicuspidata NRRL YB-4993]OBA19519.1 hypothetical protein METBIDRAFT_45812 [Metschnikowia bicuspidata var. bicuspidata NRRL YB-4993]
MAPPKKDAFSDLLNYAHENLLKSLTGSSLTNLSLKPGPQAQAKPSDTNNWGNLDILMPTLVLSPPDSTSLTPLNISDPFDFFELNSRPEMALVQSSSPSGMSDESSPAPKLPNRPSADATLLDDEFTDAFPSTALKPQRNESPIAEPAPKQQNSDPSTQTGERDHVLAALMSEGFPIDIANKAIDRVGPDFEKCVRLIVMKSVRPETQRLASPSMDLGSAFQGVSNDIYKKATWLLDQSRKTVIKNINNLQAQRARREGNDLPAWIASQHKYKDQAVERKKDGGNYEDYGTDDENINEAEIRSIVQAQRQKEVERQRQRLEALGKPSKPKGSHDLQSSRENRTTGPSSVPGHVTSSELPVAPERQHHLSSQSSASSLHKNEHAQAPPTPEVDLLGLGTPQAPLTRAQRFKQNSKDDMSYVSPSRRRHADHKSTERTPRPATSEPLNTFAQSDYETHKAKGAASFSAGDYDNALTAYNRCLQSLPEKHELRIVITSNLALTAIKIGNYRLASLNCEEGLALVGDHAGDLEWLLNDKNIKYWFVRLLARKAESLEMLENFPASLECYMLLITKYGVNDKKTMDAKRRVNIIVNPVKQTSKPTLKPAPLCKTSPSFSSNKKLDQVKNQHMKEKLQEQQKFQLHDVVDDRIQQWSRGKEDNLRALLMSLTDVLPQHLGFPFITNKKITINELMLTKKVKVHYMKVISNIHPDKLGSFLLEDQMICQAVFVTLNKAWDTFKVQNNIS